MDLEEIKEIYKNDRFAYMAGCEIIQAEPGKAVCEMPIGDVHLNAHGGVMGGAIFTLADFAFAVCSNYSGVPSVGIECNIRYFSAPKGKKLIAVCTTDKEGRTLGHYTVDISDETGRKVAGFTSIAFHKN